MVFRIDKCILKERRVFSPNHYLGSLCKRGHEYQDTGKSLKRTTDGGCLKCRGIHGAIYQKKYKETINAKSRRWRESNKEKVAQINKRQYERNREALILRSKLRFGELYKATPAWSDKAKIRLIYQKARQLTDTTGIKHQVDHIIPLKSPLVCGLHVPENLQVLTANQNAKKSNHWRLA